MNFSLRGVSLISWAFIALSISAASLLVVSAYNYVSFYPALAQLQLSTSKITMEGNNSTGYQLVFHVSLSNPSGNSGFSLRDISLRFFFTNTTNSTGPADYLYRPISFIGSLYVTRQLAAHSNYSFAIGVSLDSADVASLKDFSRLYPGQVMANVSSVAEIVTFLQPVTGRISLQSVDDLPLS